MADSRKHRGRHPQDEELFASEQHDKLRAAVHDLSWLLSRGYTTTSALALVGNRYSLFDRQRAAIRRASCGDAELERRHKHHQPQLTDHEEVWIDGFNLIVTLEALLSDGVLLACRDGCVRDMASMHGTYRTVHETQPAIELAGQFLQQSQPGRRHWLLDRPVSNSGRVASLIRETATANHWDWHVELVDDPDPILKLSPHTIITADSAILDACQRWHNLVARIVDTRQPTMHVDLSCG